MYNFTKDDIISCIWGHTFSLIYILFTSASILLTTVIALDIINSIVNKSTVRLYDTFIFIPVVKYNPPFLSQFCKIVFKFVCCAFCRWKGNGLIYLEKRFIGLLESRDLSLSAYLTVEHNTSSWLSSLYYKLDYAIIIP